ncbi:hypothetical protein K3495_g8123 [Podosphaera aphanis]|nr:hypothetical protein K3495_g8123 [Podosphaera aphanis]
MTWKLAIALAAKNSLEIHQMDVVAVFLHGDIDGDIYVELLPQWNEILNIQNNGDNVCKLNKSLYGLKQPPRLWQQKLKRVQSKLKFIPLLADEAAYINTRREEAIIIITHVDDSLIISKLSSHLDEFKQKISSELDIDDLGHTQYFLGVRIIRNIDGSIYLCQDAYINKVLNTFGMDSCYIEKTPMDEGAKEWLIPHNHQASEADIHEYQRMMGSINYLTYYTRMDIALACGALMRYLHNPSAAHSKAGKRILRYLAGTKYLAIKFDEGTDDHLKLHGYTDANFANLDKNGCKCHSG